VSQHFLLSKAARSLSLARVARLSDEEAFDTFRLVRWSATKGEPVCPRRDCAAVYTYKARKLWKCKACSHQFSVTSGTIFASRKMPIRDILLAVAIFVNGAKGHSALQLSRDLDCQYKTAFVLAHKIREALGTDADERTLAGEVEVDGAYFGGYVKPANDRENRRDRRLAENQTGKCKVVVVMRERGGETLPFVFRSEAAAVATIGRKVALGSTIYADEAASWDRLHARFLTTGAWIETSFPARRPSGDRVALSRGRGSKLGSPRPCYPGASSPSHRAWIETRAGPILCE